MGSTFLGLFSARRIDGHRLHDGNAAAIRVSGSVASSIVAIGEERLTGEKHGDGFAKSAEYCLESVGHRGGDQLHVGFASSLDRPWTTDEVRREIESVLGLSPTTIRVVRHHDSHAMGAFVGSGMRDALVLILDGEGNRLSGIVESTTVYRGTVTPDGGVRLELLGRESLDGRGVGQLYRGATKFLGFPSYHDASKVMALAGIGLAQGIEPLGGESPRDVSTDLMQRLDPHQIKQSFAAAVRHHLPAARALDPSWFSSATYDGRLPHTREQLRVAVTVQDIVEREMVRIAEVWRDSTGLTSVCVGGGVAMNCVATARLRREGFDVFVPGAPSDEGQGLGCLLTILNENVPELIPPRIHGSLGYAASSSADESEMVNDLLKGRIVARHFGASEYGPRALGHRSLLAAPSLDIGILDTLREVKMREKFQPFAAVITSEKAELLGLGESPYMSFAPRLSGEALDYLKPVVHADLTCRIQTLENEDDPQLYSVVREVEEAGAGPIVNTSLNRRREPLLEFDYQTLSLLTDSPEISVAYVNGRRHTCQGVPRERVQTGR